MLPKVIVTFLKGDDETTLTLSEGNKSPKCFDNQSSCKILGFVPSNMRKQQTTSNEYSEYSSEEVRGKVNLSPGKYGLQ